MRRGWGRVLGFAGVLALVGLVPVVFGWERLPDPFASHWGRGAQPDNSMPLWALPLLPVGVVGLGLFMSAMFRVKGRPSAEAMGLLGLLGALGVAASFSTVSLNLDATVWDEAGRMSPGHILLVLTAPLVGGAIGVLLGRRWFPPIGNEGDGIGNAVIEVADGEKVAWVGTCRVSYPYLIAGGMAVLFVFSPEGWRWVAVMVFAIAILLSHVGVTVGDHGLRVRLGGIPVRRIALEEIGSVGVIDLNPGEWGGWGYRMVPGRAAVVLRRGEAIEVRFPSGRRFAVTVDDAATGAALLNGLLAKRARSG